jgi:hypothetical protein
MARALSLRWPSAGLGLGVVALALWLAALPTRLLDLLVGLLLVAGFGLALAGWLRSGSRRARLVAVVALGWNAIGLGLLVAVYVAG